MTERPGHIGAEQAYDATGYEKLSWRYRLVLFRRIPGHVRYYGLRATGAWVYERVIRGVRRAS